MFTNRLLRLVILASLACFFEPGFSQADWDFMPESRHHLYQTYANFIEQQNMVAWRGGSQYWASVSINLPLAGDNADPGHPQFLMHLSANDSMHINNGGGVFTEILDTRLGFFLELAVPSAWDLRFSAGFLHISGHTVDGIDDPELTPYDLADNVLRIQVFRDFDKWLRTSLLVAPVIHSIPSGYPTLISGTIEYFPLQQSDDPNAFSPYISGSLTHRASLDGKFGIQLQAGIAVGNHFQEKHTHDLRLALGYYNGVDPRAKYAQYDHNRVAFWFLGTMFNL